MASDSDSRKITTGYAYTISGTTVSWVSRLQNIVALYTTEAKYVAMTEATKELVWLHNFLEELGQNRKNILYYDSHSAIHLAKDSVYHARTKHIQVWYYYLQSVLQDGKLALEKIKRYQNPIDMLMKTITIEKLKLYTTSVGLLT